MAYPHRTSPAPSLRQVAGQQLEVLERDLEKAAARSRMALVIPGSALAFRGAAFRRAVGALRETRYLSQIVIAVSAASRRQAEEAGKLFEGFGPEVTVLWTDDPGLPASLRHTGAQHWLPLALLVTEGNCEAIAVDGCLNGHGARHTVASLLHPVAVASSGFSFVKGYAEYGEDANQRRLTRLFFRPLVKSIQRMTPECACAGTLASIKSPLYGSYALRTRLAREMRLTVGGGFQTALLSEALRLAGVERIGEVGIHHPHVAAAVPALVAAPDEGLVHTALEVFGAVAAEGRVLTSDQMRTLEVLYRRMAEDSLPDYAAAAGEDGVIYNQHQEECSVTRYGAAIKEAVRRFKSDPASTILMPVGGFAGSAAAAGSIRALCAVEAAAESPLVLSNWERWTLSEEVVTG